MQFLYFVKLFLKLLIYKNTSEYLQFSMKIYKNLRLKNIDVPFHIVL